MKYKYKDDKGNIYKVGIYRGCDSDKIGKYQVYCIDEHGNRHLAAPVSQNPWTTEKEAEHKLHRLAEREGWKKT